MSYTKQTWVTESTLITAERLNNMEGGIADANDGIDIRPMVAINHRNVYRGASLGSSLTSAQLAEIQDGTFDGLYIGDYWTINSVNWRIADIDYWYNTGDTAFTSHHLVIVPDTSLLSAPMNDSDTTTGGYIGSTMYTESLETVKTTVAAAFGDNVLSHREYFTNVVTSGYPSAGQWVDSTVDLMNEIMVYGCHIQAPMRNGTLDVNKYTIDKQQLALFMLNPRMLNRRLTFWLRDVVSSTSFANTNYAGYASYTYASLSYGIRPAFAVG